MKVGIVEICVDGHYMIVNSLIKTYLENKNTQIYLYITPKVFSILKNEIANNSKIIIHLLENKPKNLFAKIEGDNLDRVHFNTVTKYFNYFYDFSLKFMGKIYFHFHNIDLWFNSTIIYETKQLANIILKGEFEIIYRQIKYALKQIYFSYSQKKLIKYLLYRKNTFFIILSESQKFHLSKYVKVEDNTIIFPSIIFEGNNYKDLSLNNKKMRVCIPGSVSQKRREYNKLFKVLRKNKDFFQNNVVFDFLGFLPTDESIIENEIKKLILEGFEIIYYTSFIDDIDFDENLYKSDIILSNIHVDTNSKTPQNKETATVFNMVRCAKPGLFPKEFILDSSFTDSVLKFDDYEHLKVVLEDLINNNFKLIKLKGNSLMVSEKYSPNELIKVLL